MPNDISKSQPLRRWASLFRSEALVLAALLFAAVGLLVFAEVADEVVEGEIHSLDKRVLQALRSSDDPADPIGPAWLHEAAVDITALGSFTVLAIFVLATVVYLALYRNYRGMVLVLIATFGGLLLNNGLKWIFARERPDIVPHLVHVQTLSFPSGHAMLSMIIYLTLGVLLSGLVERRRGRVFFFAFGLILAFLIGLSRVYLGVHYPTDILAGWSLGLAWALLVWLGIHFEKRWRARNRQSPDPAQPAAHSR